jgi:ribosomal protein S18 acetylase RimI-like enzyme
MTGATDDPPARDSARTPALRRATEDDIAAVLELWKTAEGPASVSDTREGLMSLLARDRDALVLAEVDGAIVGTLIAAWDGWRGSFYKLVVHPRHRRRGLAKALIQEGERRLLAAGAVRLTAIVVDHDPVAMSFWQVAGYERQAQRARFIRHVGR